MTGHAIIFTPDGQGRGLHTEAIDLGLIGPLVIERATHIEFDNKAQYWRVYDNTGFRVQQPVSASMSGLGAPILGITGGYES
jgi:hypothetical protein